MIFLAVFNLPSIAGENQIHPTSNESPKQEKQLIEVLPSTSPPYRSGKSVAIPQFSSSNGEMTQPQNHGNVDFSTPIHTIAKPTPGAEALGVVSLQPSPDNFFPVPVYSASANNSENSPGEGKVNVISKLKLNRLNRPNRFNQSNKLNTFNRSQFRTAPEGTKTNILPTPNCPPPTDFVSGECNLPSTQSSTPPSLVATSNKTSTNNQDINEILNQLEELPKQEFTIPIERGYLLSPALTIANPNGYGADGRTLFASASYQRRTRFTKTNDGELGLGIGVGNAVKSVGVELAYTLNTFGTSQDFGSGAFSIKIHRRISEDFAVAAGWNQFASILINPKVPFDYPKNSYYVVATKVFKTRPYISQPFSRVAVTLGVGSGQFLPFDKIQAAAARDEAPTGLGIFGSLSLRVLRPVSAIVEWTGQDLGVGLSIVPFKNIPLVITPAIRDITGAGDGARFIMGAGVGIRF
ncbi:hypothetical protein [Calothrix sp. NIES-3974]|uniref:hypothetical protein n=1 Tax=Calothrix sp. NIES-3974 TaxID=2005462 RepID=UPI0012FD4285|nr:hypothetical protein [Calothrix sp. NIES-3974]